MGTDRTDELRRPAGWHGDKLRILWVLAFNKRLRHENRILKEKQDILKRGKKDQDRLVFFWDRAENA